MIGLISAAHQLALSFGGLEGYVLDAPRVGVFSANKEGIVSLTGMHTPCKHLSLTHANTLRIGYLAIHLLGLSAGTLILPPTPSHFRREQRAQLVRTKSTPHAGADTDTDNDSDEDVSEKRVRTKTKSQSAQRQNDKTAIELVSYAVVWWVLLGATRALGGDEGVSRRMVGSSSLSSTHQVN